ECVSEETLTRYPIYRTPQDPNGKSWAPLPASHCPPYEVSTHGRVRHRVRRKDRAIRGNRYGPLMRTLREGGSNGPRRTTPRGHAVAPPFLGQPDDSRPSAPTKRKDGAEKNCRLDDLSWRTRAYVRRYDRDWHPPANPSGLSVRAVDENYRLLGRYESEGALAQAYGVLVGDVVRAEALHTDLPFNPGIYVTYDSVL